MLARLLCRQNGRHFIVDVTQKGAPAYVLYRKRTHKGERHVRIGRRKDPAEMLKLVQTVTGLTEPANAATAGA